MNGYLIGAAALAAGAGVVHSWLGERALVARQRRDDRTVDPRMPPYAGSTGSKQSG